MDPDDLIDDVVRLPFDGRRQPTLFENVPQLPHEPKDVEFVRAAPPPPTQPDAVVQLLRDEVKDKYGPEAAATLPIDIGSKQRGQIRRGILQRYEATIVIKMIRLLVWDWEVARVSCFPPKGDIPYPTVEALIQYKEKLAPLVNSGFRYPRWMSGERRRYRDIYLKHLDDSPF